MPRACKSYKSSHSSHVKRDCGRVVGSLFVGISRRKRQPSNYADSIFSNLSFQEKPSGSPYFEGMSSAPGT